MKKLLKHRYLTYSLFIIIGLFLGWLFFHSSVVKEDKHNHVTPEEGKATIWTCSMHPQIRMEKPGKCPICGMDLIPLNQSMTPIDPDAIHLTKEAAELANVLTSVVTKQKPVKEVRLYGKVQADERLLQSQVAHIPGRIEKLMVNFTGEGVRKGQTLALVYSPELITAQQELLETVETKQVQPEIYEAAKEKLRQWKLTDAQIAGIETTGNVKNNFEVVSNTTGIVTTRRVNNGDYIAAGTVLYDIADLSKVWVMFDAYESDLPFLREGDKLSFTVQAIPGKTFNGNIAFIDPVIEPTTRVSKVRVEINNQSGKLKPEMFATGIVNANLAEYSNKMVIPRSSVLWTGKRSIVYVKQAGSNEPIFKIREIELGPMLGNSYVVINGLDEGEEIVTQGTFNVDAAAQLEGKPSMMNQGSVQTSEIHDHGVVPANHTGHNTTEKTTVNKANADFKNQLNNVLDKYVLLGEALVQSDANKAQQAAQEVQRSLDKINMQLLTGDAHVQWMDMSGKINNQAKQISSSDKIEDQRLAFISLSDQLYKTIKTFGLKGKTIYYQFCPMVNDGNGAYWLSKAKEIRNPYYGDAMLTCGETKETLKY